MCVGPEDEQQGMAPVGEQQKTSARGIEGEEDHRHAEVFYEFVVVAFLTLFMCVCESFRSSSQISHDSDDDESERKQRTRKNVNGSEESERVEHVSGVARAVSLHSHNYCVPVCSRTRTIRGRKMWTTTRWVAMARLLRTRIPVSVTELYGW